MKWCWRRHRKADADEAIAAAQERLDAAEAAEPKVSQVVGELHRIRAENRYGARLIAALRERR